MRRFYHHEAAEMIETIFEVCADQDEETQLEVTLANADLAQVRADVDFWTGMIGAAIDPDSIEITPDNIDDVMPAVRVLIKLEAE